MELVVEPEDSSEEEEGMLLSHCWPRPSSLLFLDIPEEFLCPISQEPMVDPFVSPEGHTFDWNHIVRWLAQRKRSPLTATPLNIAELGMSFVEHIVSVFADLFL